jgi:hypothetical protein
MIITYREGLSGNWLSQLVLINNVLPKTYFRQDVDGSNVPDDILHYDGYLDEHSFKAHRQYKNQRIITCHSTNYSLLRTLWPDKKIIRIVPYTNIFQAIAAAFYKLGPGPTCTVDSAFEYIKDYYNLHSTLDPKPAIENSFIVDFGDLTNFDKLTSISKSLFDIDLRKEHHEFFKNYWSLQKTVVDESLLHNNITKESLSKIYSTVNDSFHIACFIFIYEKYNNLTESQRRWTIENDPETVDEMIKVMHYNP